MKCSRKLKNHCRNLALKKRSCDDEDEEQVGSDEDEMHYDDIILPEPKTYVDTGTQSKEMKRPKGFAAECVFSTLVSGGTYEQMNKFCANSHHNYVSRGTFFTEQKKIGMVVKDLAEKSMEKARENVTTDSIIGADGRYPNRRNASHCSVDFIDQGTKKIVALGIVDKKSSYHPDEDFELSSNLLESKATERGVEHLVKSVKPNAFVLDGDNKNRKMFRQSGFNPELKSDPNHLKKSFEKYLEKQLGKHKKMIQGIDDCFYGLRSKIKIWYSFLLGSKEIEVERKIQLWENTTNHLLGDHTYCMDHEETDFVWKHGVDFPICAGKLAEILNSRTEDFTKVQADANTQLNESFHQTQLKFGDKNHRFPISQEIRDNLAVLDWNERQTYMSDLREALDLPDLEPKYASVLQSSINEREKRRERRGSEEYKAIRNQYRKEERERHKSHQKGDYKPDTSDSE